MAHKEEAKAQIQYRHTPGKTYNLLVEYMQGLNPNTGWYCGCRSGARNVEYCAHVAFVLWYLGYYSSETKIVKPNQAGYTGILSKMQLLSHGVLQVS